MGNLFKAFGSNRAGGRDLIVGDVHGCFTKLRAALDAARFDEGVDRLFSVGDLVDRGPESAQVLDWLAKPWFHAIAGNHEMMLLEFVCGQIGEKEYVQNGGEWFVELLPVERVPYVDAIGQLPLAIELQTADGVVGLVHAECPRQRWGEFKSLACNPEHSAQMVLCAQWSRGRISRSDRSVIDDVRAVVVGHSPTERITWLGNTVYIDSGA